MQLNALTNGSKMHLGPYKYDVRGTVAISSIEIFPNSVGIINWYTKP